MKPKLDSIAGSQSTKTSRDAWRTTSASPGSTWKRPTPLLRWLEKNEALGERVLAQSRDRYGNGVTNYLEVIHAQEAVTAAGKNYIQSLYSFNVAKAALARAMGAAERRFTEFF